MSTGTAAIETADDVDGEGDGIEMELGMGAS